MPDESSPASRDVEPRLRARLEDAADEKGFIPFDRFMDVALYADEVGYYQRSPSPFGGAGDFYTAAHVTPLFGAALAERVREVRRQLDPGRPFHLVELGSGDGRLLRDCLTQLARYPDELPGIEVTVVERSPTRESAAAAAIGGVARPLGLSLQSRDSVATLGPFEGVVVANELLDAQPIRRLRRAGDGWTELGVRLDGDRVVPAEEPALAEVPGPALPTDVEPGTILEVSPRAEGIVREVADHLVRGVFVALDYGMEESELVRAHPEGTLAAVRAHRTGGDPRAAPGETDLSAFVNFSRIRSVAATAGLSLLADRRQSEALGAWGFERLLQTAISAAPDAEAEVRLRLAVKSLLFGFERFRVLEFLPGGEAARASPPR